MNRCETCGKFRSAENLARSWHGDTDGGDKTECYWCMSEADRRVYFKGHFAKCKVCSEGMHLEFAGSDMGALAGASVWEHDRWRSTMYDDHDPIAA